MRLGFQPGYSDSWVTSAPATLKAASMRMAALRRAELVELRWLVPIRIILSSCILTEARLDEVSTSPLDEVECGLVVHCRGRQFQVLLPYGGDVRIRNRIFVAQFGEGLVKYAFYLGCIRRIDGYHSRCLAGYGVALVAAVDAAEGCGSPVPYAVEQSREGLYCVGAALVDVVSAVPADAAAESCLDADLAGRDGNGSVVEFRCGVDTSGAADEQFALVLGVEVEQYAAGEEVTFESECSVQPGLLGGGEEALYLAVR